MSTSSSENTSVHRSTESQSSPAASMGIDHFRRSEERFRKIFDHSNDAIFVIDPETDVILNANPRACTMLGYTRDELLSITVSAVHPDEMPQLRAFAESVFREGKGWTNELTCLTKWGAGLPSEISASVFEVGGRKCILAMVRDITERRQAERALKESEERLATIVGSAMDAIIAIDRACAVCLFNAAAERVFRCASSETIGKSFDRFLPEPFRRFLGDSMQACERGEAERCLTWIPQGLTARRGDGTEFPVEGTVSQMQTRGETLYTIILRDVNDRKKAEEELRRLQLENVYLREEVEAELGPDEIIGSSPAIRAVLSSAEQVAPTDATVLITGETGTGKELIARFIHQLSDRKDGVMVTVNCAALPSGLIESELFGHERGAFTGALTRKIGRFEMAHRSTIFLDEIGDLPLELQAKLLRVLQERCFERVGGTGTLCVDVRVIAATNRDLQKEVPAQQFRADLFYRLNVFPLRVPPLRERTEDILLPARHFVMRFAPRMGKRIETIPSPVLNTLAAYDWPGNVRELQNVIERAVIISRGPQLELGEWLPLRSGAAVAPESPQRTLKKMERTHILAVLEETKGKISGTDGAAAILGLKPSTLQSRMKKLGVRRKP